MIKTIRTLIITAALAALFAPSAHAGKQHICPVSGDVLGGDMGPPVAYSEGGKTIQFCCKSCVKKYKADPAKYAVATQKALGGS
jgi:YHS domain-containing protein